MITLCLVLSGMGAYAIETLCAEVQIEVRQEATLIRQGFDAHMRINNGLPISLDDLTVEVEITDADENIVSITSETDNTNAAFFVRVDHLKNVNSASNGTVNASTSADLNWLIIPTVHANVSNQWGDVFYVGASLKYSIDGKTNEVTVVPDGILVKPLPELALDYFLPEEVYGDDPGTSGIEEIVPFSLGVRAKNSGYGTAKTLKINSAQPEIKENDQGLLVGFVITGSEVNGQTVPNSLLVDFGTVEPGKSSLARWVMECSLSGEFTAFSADITHADELGGEMTSLITTSRTHFLVHDVLVDLNGRDIIRDFLTMDMNVYESDGVETSVSDISTDVSLSGSGTEYTVSGIPGPVSGPVYIKLTNTAPSYMELTEVIRSDGRRLPEANRWISLTRNAGAEPTRQLNLFDADGSGADYYTVYYEEDASVSNNAPVWVAVGGQFAYVGREMQFAVHASDPDGTVPSLAAVGKPAASVFSDYSNGYGYFSWTPGTGDAGTSTVSFTAADPFTNSVMNVAITVRNWTTSTNNPAWWYDYGVIATNATANDYAPVNQGQVKYMAWAAYKQTEKIYGGTNGTGGAGFEFAYTNNADNYMPVNIGQAKTVVMPFYDRLGVTNYSWMTSTNDANDFAMVNIGQIKNLFSFDPLKDSDGDGLPDWWELLYNLNPTNSADGVANRDEYFNNIVPTP